MHKVIRSGELQPSPGGTITFEGEPHASGVSFFLVNSEPGAGPGPAPAPSLETWIVRGGRALFTADGEEPEAGPRHHRRLLPRRPTSSRALGPERLDIVCIHASPTMIQENLE